MQLPLAVRTVTVILIANWGGGGGGRIARRIYLISWLKNRKESKQINESRMW